MNQTEILVLISMKLIEMGVNPKSLEVLIERNHIDFGYRVSIKHTRGMKQIGVSMLVSDQNLAALGEDIDKFVADRMFVSLQNYYIPNKAKWIKQLFDRIEMRF